MLKPKPWLRLMRAAKYLSIARDLARCRTTMFYKVMNGPHFIAIKNNQTPRKVSSLAIVKHLA